jgi:TolB-like protein/tetratricopeptide (TPR) repeat protein
VTAPDEREPADDAELTDLAEAILEGRKIDWDEVERAAGPEQAPLLRQLRLLAGLVATHQSLQPADLPRQWAHLKLLEQIGQGAFGHVYRAWDTHLDREVALKLLDPGAEPDSAAGRSVIEEGRLLARVRHPNVITVYGAEKFAGQIGIWTEFVRGRTLDQWVREQGPMSAQEAAAVGIDLCRALSAVHSAGLLHGDVKARNVMREAGGRIVLMDFGAGRDSTAGPFVDISAGTPVYLAPEVIAERSATSQSDIYSLSVLLFYLVTGTYPTPGHTLDEIRAAHSQGRRTLLRDARPDLPLTFIDAVEKGLESDPAARHATPGQLQAALRRAQAGSGFLTPAIAAAAAAPPPRPARKSLSRLAAVALGVLALLAIALALDLGGLRRLLGDRAVRSRGISAFSSSAAPIRLAVLPFEAAGGAPDTQTFGDGLAEDLIDRLNRHEGLRVVSKTSAFSFRGGELTLPDIGSRLNVAALLTGEAHLTGETIEIRSRLVRAADQRELWSQVFVRPLAEIFAVQGEIAAGVAEALQLDPERKSRAWPTQNLDAYTAYVRGRSALDETDAAATAAALALFEKAVRLDPDYAQAYAGIALAYAQLAYGGDLPGEAAYPQAQKATKRALELDDELSEAHLAAAVVKFQFEWDWKGIEREFQRAIELDPGSVDARWHYSTVLSVLGRFPEALEQARLAESLDPFLARACYTVAVTYRFARRYDECIAQARHTLEVDAGFGAAHLALAHCYRGQGKLDEAIAEYLVSGCASCGVLGLTYASAGRPEEARRILAGLEASHRTNGIGAGQIAQVYIGLGDSDRAFEWLERARGEHSLMQSLKTAELWDPLRSDPRFAQLLASIGLGDDAKAGAGAVQNVQGSR